MHLFNPDSPVFSFLSKLADLIIINILVIICSLPVFTIGAAWTAMYYVTVKLVKNEESYVTKDFFKSFKLNFRQATCIWLINIIVLTLMATDAVIIIRGGIEQLPQPLLIVMIIMGLFAIAVMLYVYPLLSHFDNSIKNTIKNAFILVISNFPYTLLFLAVVAVTIGLSFTKFGVRLLPVYILIGISGPAYICSLAWKRIFDKLDPIPETIRENDGKQEEKEAESESE